MHWWFQQRLQSRQQGLIQHCTLRALSPRHSAIHMWDDVFLGQRNFPVTHLLRRTSRVITRESAEESGGNTWSHRRDRPINAKKSSERSPPMYNLTTYFTGERYPPALMCASLITFHIKRPSLAANIHSPNSKLCVSNSSSAQQAIPQLIITRDGLIIFETTSKIWGAILYLFIYFLAGSTSTPAFGCYHVKDWKYT